MNGSTIIFYLLGAFTLGCAVLSVTTKHIFRAAVSLLFALMGVAGIYFWMNYQFIAAVQVVVYVGGIVVLILFSIFLTQQSGEKLPGQKRKRTLFSALAALCGLALTLVQITGHQFAGSSARPVEVTVRSIGEELIALDKNGYALPFEVVSMLLLAAMIGCIVIAMRTPAPAEEKKAGQAKEEVRLIIPKEEKLVIIQEETGGMQ